MSDRLMKPQRGTTSPNQEPGRPTTSTRLDADQPAPILFDGEHQPITTRNSWEVQRKSLISAWEAALGAAPSKPDNREIEVLEQELLPEHSVIRERIQYQVEPGFTTQVYRLAPIKPTTGPRPGCLVFHSTVDHTIRQPAGLEGPPELHLGLQLAQLGMIALCPMNFLWRFGTGPDKFQQAVAWHQEQHPESTGMALMLHEARIALDVLRRDSRVEGARIGAIGHSLGAKEVLYLAAFEPQIHAAVFSEGGLALPDSNWDAPWYLGPQVRRPGFPLDHGRLLALIAPRPFLVIGGDSADGDRTWPTIEACRPVWDLYPRTDSGPGQARSESLLGFLNHHGGHQLPSQAHDHALAWLQSHLGS